MNAKDSRKRATVVADDKIKCNYESIEKKVNESVDKGHFVTNFFNEILLENEMRLKEEGFVIEKGTARQGEYNYIIKW